jgi:hypothetical protein
MAKIIYTTIEATQMMEVLIKEDMIAIATAKGSIRIACMTRSSTLRWSQKFSRINEIIIMATVNTIVVVARKEVTAVRQRRNFQPRRTQNEGPSAAQMSSGLAMFTSKQMTMKGRDA